MIKTALLRTLALSTGLCAASVLGGMLGGEGHSLGELLLPVLIGNGMVGAGLAVAALLLALVPALRPRLNPPGCFALGFLPGLAPLLGLAGLPIAGVAAAAVILAAAALAFGPRWPLRGGWRHAGVVALTFAVALGGGWQRYRELRDRGAVAPDYPLPAAGAADLAPAPDAPDIILVSLDTLRADAIVGPREPAYELPWFDGKRAAGSWWDYGYSSSNQTLPGHASMLSGLDAIGSGVRHNFDRLPGPERYRLLQEHLRDAGFHTAGVISNSLLSSSMGFGRGYHAYDDSAAEDYSPRLACVARLRRMSWFGMLLPPQLSNAVLDFTTFRPLRRPLRDFAGAGHRQRGRVTTDQALEMLDRLYASERPFYFFLHYLDPHHPYGAPPGFDGRLTDGLPPLPARYQPAPGHPEQVIELAQLHRMRADLQSDDAAVRAQAAAGAEHYRRIYLENVLYLDALLQEVQARVDASGRPALWLVTADHGEQFGENGALIHGNHLYQDSLRVPFLIEGPGVPAAHRQDLVPDVADVAPTLLAYLRIEPAEGMTGRPLLHASAGPRPHVCGDDARLMVRDGDWKLIADRGDPAPTPTALYDLAADPEEQRNLLGADEHRGTTARLIGLLVEELARERYEPSTELAAGQAEALEELGYVEGDE